MKKLIFNNEFVKIYREDVLIPWYKIFTTDTYKELTDCPKELREKLYYYMELLEKELRAYYKPIKINIAMFGNHLPHMHIHVMARFEKDEYFPEAAWGEKQRKPELSLPSEDIFLKILLKALQKPF